MQKQSKRDMYQWRVMYGDGSVTDEFDPTRPDGRGFAERETKPVDEISLMAWEPFDNHLYRVQIPQGAEPVFFRRRSVSFTPTEERAQQGTLAHCIGWKRGNEAAYLFVLPDGSTLLTPDLHAI